jgi:hypothetical protein
MSLAISLPQHRGDARTESSAQTAAAGGRPRQDLVRAPKHGNVFFAVPNSPDHAYFDPTFVNRNTRNGESVIVNQGTAQVVDLTLSSLK